MLGLRRQYLGRDYKKVGEETAVHLAPSLAGMAGAMAVTTTPSSSQTVPFT